MRIEPARKLRGVVMPPGDKSISHRYAILGALAHGTTEISNYSPSQDCQSTLDCLAALGVSLDRTDGVVAIQGEGLAGLRRPAAPLDAGNSGTTMRLLSGVLASLPFRTVIQGDASLNQRPMKRIIVPLSQMGARIEAADGEHPPLSIRGGRLTGIRYQSPIASAQVKSCVLLAGLSAKGTTAVREPALSRDHTERALPVFGVSVERSGLEVSLRGGTPLTAAAVAAPGDFSAAAFFILAALMLPNSEIEIKNLGINPSRIGLLDLLLESGADIRRDNEREVCGEPICDLTAAYDEKILARFPETVSGHWIPNLIDEIPALAVFAARLPKGLTVRDAAELRRKESDRIAAVASNLRNLGVSVQESPDGFHVPPGQRLRGGAVRTFGDHRIAMAFAIAALSSEESIELDDLDCTAVSFPGFFESLEALSRR